MLTRPQRPFELVIVDNDGILVDSEWYANGILADLLCEAGLPSTREGCIAEYMGRTLARVREIAGLRLGRPLPAVLLTSHALPRHSIAAESVEVRLGNAPEPHGARIERIDEDHANARVEWLRMGSPEHLRRADVERLQGPR